MQSRQPQPVRVIHHLPGRTRLSWAGLFLNQRDAQRLARHLSGRDGIRQAWASHRSGRLLVHHDPSLSLTRVLELVQEALKVIAVLEGAAPDDLPPRPALEPEDQPLIRHFSRVGGVGSLLLYLLVRRKVRGPSRLASSPLIFNLMAATALTAGYPNIKNGLRYFTGRRSGGHDLLLGLATLTLLFLGEGFLGLTVVWLVNVTDLVQALLWQKARAIHPLAGGATSDRPDHLTEDARNYAERAAGFALAGGVLAGMAARDLRRSLAVLLAANPSAAGLVGPAALTGAAARAQVLGVAFVSRRAVAALARVDAYLVSPAPGGRPEDPGDIRRLAEAGLPEAPEDHDAQTLVSRVERLQAGGSRVAVLGRAPEDLAAMQEAYLALARRGAPAQVLAAASLYLPDASLAPLVVARRLAQAAARQAGRGLLLVRLANLAGLVLAGAGSLSPARSTLWAHLTSLGALLVAVRPPGPDRAEPAATTFLKSPGPRSPHRQSG